MQLHPIKIAFSSLTLEVLICLHLSKLGAHACIYVLCLVTFRAIERKICRMMNSTSSNGLVLLSLGKQNGRRAFLPIV